MGEPERGKRGIKREADLDPDQKPEDFEGNSKATSNSVPKPVDTKHGIEDSAATDIIKEGDLVQYSSKTWKQPITSSVIKVRHDSRGQVIAYVLKCKACAAVSSVRPLVAPEGSPASQKKDASGATASMAAFHEETSEAVEAESTTVADLGPVTLQDKETKLARLEKRHRVTLGDKMKLLFSAQLIYSEKPAAPAVAEGEKAVVFSPAKEDQTSSDSQDLELRKRPWLQADMPAEEDQHFDDKADWDPYGLPTCGSGAEDSGEADPTDDSSIQEKALRDLERFEAEAGLISPPTVLASSSEARSEEQREVGEDAGKDDFKRKADEQPRSVGTASQDNIDANCIDEMINAAAKADRARAANIAELDLEWVEVMKSMDPQTVEEEQHQSDSQASSSQSRPIRALCSARITVPEVSPQEQHRSNSQASSSQSRPQRGGTGYVPGSFLGNFISPRKFPKELAEGGIQSPSPMQRIRSPSANVSSLERNNSIPRLQNSARNALFTPVLTKAMKSGTSLHRASPRRRKNAPRHYSRSRSLRGRKTRSRRGSS